MITKFNTLQGNIGGGVQVKTTNQYGGFGSKDLGRQVTGTTRKPRSNKGQEFNNISLAEQAAHELNKKYHR